VRGGAVSGGIIQQERLTGSVCEANVEADFEVEGLEEEKET
jgi:hypothetical protein